MKDGMSFRRIVEELKAGEDFDVLVNVLKLPTSAVSDALNMDVQVAFEEHIEDQEFAELVTAAESSPKVFDGLKRSLAMRLLTENRELTSYMLAWIAGVLTGEISRPKSIGGPDRSAGGIKRIIVAGLVHNACQLGLQRTRNVASEPTSACDAVVVALEEVGFHTTYDAISKSWSTHAQVWMKEELD